MTITAITLSNFKGIADPVTIPIKPITLLFGKNSAGKSTIIQAIHYCLAVLNTGNGDVDTVDLGGNSINLGGFENLVHMHDLGNEIKIRFDLDYSGVNWLKEHPIDELLISVSDDSTLDLSTIGSDTETGWIEISIAIGKRDDDELAHVQHTEIGFDGIWLARFGDWWSREANRGISDIRIDAKEGCMGNLQLNEIHPLLTLENELPADSNFHLLDVIGSSIDDEIVAYPLLKAYNSEESKVVTPKHFEELYYQKNASTKTIKNIEYYILNYRKPENIEVGTLKSCDIADATAWIGKDSSTQSLEIFHIHFDLEAGSVPSDRNAVDYASDKALEIRDAIENMRDYPGYQTTLGLLPNWKEPMRLYGHIGENKKSDDHQRVHHAYIAEKCLDRLCLGPIRILHQELSTMCYIGPIRAIPSRNHQAPINSDNTRWADGMAAWDALFKAKPPDAPTHYSFNDREPYRLIDRVNDHLQRTLQIGYTIRREDQIGIDKYSTFVKELDDYDEQQLKGLLRQLIDNASEHKILSLIDTKRDIEVMPSDVGVGIAQIIPVVVGAIIARLSKTGIMAVEQPELHMHPGVQCKLADMFINEAKQKQHGEISRTQFILETHSEHMILRLLRRIRETSEGTQSFPHLPPLNPEDISILYIEQDPENGQRTKITPMRVDKEGEFLQPWPGGFFEERAEELFS